MLFIEWKKKKIGLVIPKVVLELVRILVYKLLDKWRIGKCYNKDVNENLKVIEDR